MTASEVSAEDAAKPQYQEEVKDYFARKAADYDLVDEQAYWRLSDTLLWRVLSDAVLSILPADFEFLDAGGGTGRWSDRLLRSAAGSRGVLYDLSVDMSAQAARKADESGYADRLTIRCGDLDVVHTELAEASFDLIISFHNVVGFLRDPEGTFVKLAGLLKKGGWLVLFAPNAYHTAYFNLLNGQIDEATSAVRGGWGRYVADMPYIHLFTPVRLRQAYARAGLSVELLTGFPLMVYPGFAETRITGTSSGLDDLLRNEDTFNRILELESEAARHGEVAARGTNIFVAGQRTQ